MRKILGCSPCPAAGPGYHWGLLIQVSAFQVNEDNSGWWIPQSKSRCPDLFDREHWKARVTIILSWQIIVSFLFPEIQSLCCGFLPQEKFNIQPGIAGRKATSGQGQDLNMLSRKGKQQKTGQLHGIFEQIRRPHGEEILKGSKIHLGIVHILKMPTKVCIQFMFEISQVFLVRMVLILISC